MPDIKHQFSSGKMNKDLDERIVPNGEYRDAMNIQVSTSEGSHVGTAQNILGNIVHHSSTFQMPADPVVVGVIGDEKNDFVYWFVYGSNADCILRKSTNNKAVTAVFVDLHGHSSRSSSKRVLGFGDEGSIVYSSDQYMRQITGINIIDDLLFWTDNYGEPKKINISKSIAGTVQAGTSHTKLMNDDTGNVGTTDVEEKHICVIRRGPSNPLNLEFNTIKGRDEDKSYGGIIKITDNPGTLANTSSLFVPAGVYPAPPLNDNYDFSSYSVGEIIYTTVNTDLDGNPDFTLEWEVGDVVVLKEYDDDGVAPTTPLRDYRIKGKIVDFNNPVTNVSGASSFTQDTSAVGFGVSASNFLNWGIGRVIVAIEIQSINGYPPTAIGGFGAGSLDYVVDLFDDETKLFEFKFPRFSYRYKYEDGEYSIFAPWSEIAFLPSSYDNHPQKGYNLGMTNKIQDILLEGLVPLDIPLDVVEIDILYKEDTSTNVYVVETISPKDTPTGPGLLNIWQIGSYYLTSETIKSLVPSNQLLRTWDNVPRRALGQEITGNRVVYANYLQQFNLREGSPYDNTLPYWQPKFEISVEQVPNALPSPIKTIKSLREYQLGVVFVDAYGRETPVLSNNTGSIKLDKSYALTGNKLSVSFANTTGPENMSYFKFYVKETSGEYYNMAMDRFYDAADGNVWLAFPSSDRNKIDIDTFLILKKGTGPDTVVNEPARYKVLAIENEAPDFVKTTKLLISTKTHTTSGSGAIDIFGNSMIDAPETGNFKFKVKYEPFYSDSGGDLHKLIQPGVELWVDFKLSAEDEISNRYRITSVKCDFEVGGPVSMSDSYYYITIDGLFNDDINFITDDPTGAASTKIIETAQIRFWKYAVENRPQFDGRFFVKIYNDGIFKQYVTKDFDNASANDYRILSRKEVYFLDESLHEPDFAGGSVQIWNATLDKPQGQAPHYATGIPTYHGTSNSTYFTALGDGEMFQYEDYYTTTSNPWSSAYAATVQAAGAMDPTRDGGKPSKGWWRKSQFWAWFVDYAWSTAGCNLQSNSLTLGSNLGADLDQYGVAGHFHSSDNFEWLAADPILGVAANKPDKKHEVWFIDNGKWRGRHTEADKVGTTTTGFNTSSQPNGGWTAGGIENYHDTEYSKINLSFGPIWSEDPLNNDDHFNISEGSPNYPHQADFVGKMKPGAQFRWKEDPNQTVYTVGANVREWNISRYTSPIGDPDLGGVARNESSDLYPANFNKYYYLKVTPNMGSVWDPTSNTLGPIIGGHNITLPISSGGGSMTSGVNAVDDVWIMMDSIVGVDVDNGSIEAQLRQGMIVESYVNGGVTINMPEVPSVVNSQMVGQYLCISEIEYVASLQKYKVYLVGYKWPLKTGDIPGNGAGALPNGFESGANVKFRQASMNMVSPTYCDNFEKMQANQSQNYGGVGVVHQRNTLFPVGYTLEWIEPVDREEVMPDFPAVWETEPKEQPELDIYYEVAGLHPLRTDSANVGRIGSTAIQTAIPYASTITSTHAYLPGVYSVLDIVLTETNGNWIVLDGLTTSANVNGVVTGESLMAFWPLVSLYVTKPDETEFGPISIEHIIDANYLNPGTYTTPNVYHAVKINESLFDETNLAFKGDVSRKMNWKLPYFNAYSFGNGVESNRIRDNFNLPYILNGVKASTTLAEQYKEERRETGLIYSGIYNSVTGINNLNQFIQAEKITKDLNPTYGSIQKLFSRDTDLVTFCEDKVLKVLANKDAVYNADGNPQLIATPNVLGQTIPFSGDYGISRNPESFASESYRAYFTDKQRGAVLRLSQDGLTPISDYGMKDWFKDALNVRSGDSLSVYGINQNQGEPPVNIIGNYDTRNNEYNLKFGFTGDEASGGLTKVQKVVSFKEENKGWVSFKSFVDMENGISVSDKYFTFKEGKAYFHNSHDVDRNTFYGRYENSSITVLLNDDPGVVKTFNTLNYEGSQTKVDRFVEYVDSLGFTHTDRDYYNLADIDGWWVTNIHTDMQDGGVPEFINKENKWFNFITGIDDPNNNMDGLDESEFSFQGLGTVASFTVAAIVPGCMDPLYVQYNPAATIDDGSCLTLVVLGCMNASATNYNALANVDDGSCQIVGCTWTGAFNYQPPPVNVPCQDSSGTPNGTGMDANGNWECCEPILIGCMNANIINTPAASPDVFGNCAPPDENIVGDPNWPSAASLGACYSISGGPYSGYDVFNFNPFANTASACAPLPGGCTDSNASNYGGCTLCVDDGSCLYEGCTDATALNYNALWDTDDGSCCYDGGCTDSDSSNYDPGACWDDGSCIPCVYGCMDINDGNYDPLATCHDCANYCAGVCGCNDPNAANYDASATSNDGSCIYDGCLDPTAANALTLNGVIINCTDIDASYAGPANYIGQISQTCGPIPDAWAVMPGVGGSIMDGVYGGNPQVMYNTCLYVIPGCTDVTMFNYDNQATVDDGSCYPVITGCMDPTAVNFVSITGDPQVDINTSDPTACCYTGGCTNPMGTNYDPNACYDDGSCIVPVLGCMDTTTGYFNTAGPSGVSGYDSLGPTLGYPSTNLCDDPTYATDQFGLNLWNNDGCMDPGTVNPIGFAATNYNPLATANGGCTYHQGCMDPSAYNYDITAYYPASTPSTEGCMDTNASNYDANVTTDNGSCCFPIIEGCLYENYTNLNGDSFENYNYGSGSLGNPYNVQGWSQFRVTALTNPGLTGSVGYDVNTHDQNMCILKDGTATTHTTNTNGSSPLFGERNPAGCTDNTGQDAYTRDYWYDYHAGLTTLPGTSTNYGGGTASGPFNWSHVGDRVITIQTYHGSAITSSHTHPFNWNENWTEFAANGTYPTDTDFYEADALVGGVANSTNWIADGQGNIEAPSGAPWIGQWDPSVTNACCRKAGCLHPYALNFDAKGYKRNPSSPMDPIYVGVGVQRRNPSTGQVHIMEKADQDNPGSVNNPYDQLGPVTANAGINFDEGGQACVTCTGSTGEVSGYTPGGTTGEPGERFQRWFNNGYDDNGNYTGDFSPKNRCGSSGNEIWEMASDTGLTAAQAAITSGCASWRLDDPEWRDCCVFPMEYSGHHRYDANSMNGPCWNGNSTTNMVPSWIAPNQQNNFCRNNGNSPDYPDVMFGGCTNPGACPVPYSTHPQSGYQQGKMPYRQAAMWDDGSCCYSIPVNQGGTGNCNPCKGIFQGKINL
jgi:hypothetical protein